MPASLENQFISDLYTSLLHLSGSELGAFGPLNKVFDGAGNSTGLALSGDRVVVNNYIYPKGFTTRSPMEWLDAFFPIGSLQLTFDENDPNTRIAGTIWDLVSQGRFLVGVGTYKDKNSDTYKFCPGAPPIANDSGNLAGEYRHTLTVDEIPSHSHTTNVGSTQVQIPSNIGSGNTFEGSPAGTENSTLSFAEQQRARNVLADKIRWNLSNDYGFSGTIVQPDNFFTAPAPDAGPFRENVTTPDEYLYPVKKGFDLNFLNKSATNYSVQEREAYLSSTNWEFKEMIGIWNGETRFIASRPAGRRNIPTNSIQNSLRNINWYEFCKDLGCIDIGDAIAGNFLEENNKTPLVSGDSNITENAENGNNDQPSTEVGKGVPHNNIPPSYGVYVWKRLT